MSEIVVGSWVRLEGTDYTHAGCVVEIRRQTGTLASTDLVRFVDWYGVVHEAARGVLDLADVPDPEVDALSIDDEPCVRREDTLSQGVARLKDEVASLTRELETAQRDRRNAREDRENALALADEQQAEMEAEMERRDKVAREKYEALERDRDYVESAMREASRRADDAERNLKVVLERESEVKETLRKTRAELGETQTHLREVNTAWEKAEQGMARGYAEVQRERERADMWQAAAADALAQLKALREAK